jgi:hypothetical protein
VEVAEHNIIEAPLPGGEFDVVHARLLVEHIGMGVLPNLLAGVRPGGLLVIEDYDMVLPVTSYLTTTRGPAALGGRSARGGRGGRPDGIDGIRWGVRAQAAE